MESRNAVLDPLNLTVEQFDALDDEVHEFSTRYQQKKEALLQSLDGRLLENMTQKSKSLEVEPGWLALSKALEAEAGLVTPIGPLEVDLEQAKVDDGAHLTKQRRSQGCDALA